MDTVFIQNIRTPYLLTIFVQNFEPPSFRHLSERRFCLAFYFK